MTRPAALVVADDPNTFVEVPDKGRANPEAAAYHPQPAGGPQSPACPRPTGNIDYEPRRCTDCLSLREDGSCRAARHGEIKRVRTWQPNPNRLDRCVGYAPGPDDPDRRPGRERWPFMLKYESRR